MTEKIIVIKGKEEEIDQLIEFILDYQEQTRELPSIEISDDLFKEYWRTEFESIENIHEQGVATKENMDKLLDHFDSDDVWEDFDQCLDNYYFDVAKKLKNGELGW